MHRLAASYQTDQLPELSESAAGLAHYLAGLSVRQLANTMNVSETLAQAVRDLYAGWNQDPDAQRVAIHSFAGDIYSGLQIASWSNADLTYAEQCLRILSGLYGVLRPLDGIMPYRLELGYRLPDEPYRNLYTFWAARAAAVLPADKLIVDLTAKEYSKLVLPYRKQSTVITPKFLTVSPKTSQPTFVVVHAKIARGALAAWLVKNRITNPAELTGFSDLGYVYDQALSTAQQPVFVCRQFGGLGLSVRLAHA